MNKTFKKYYLFSVIGILLVSYYPLYMGVKVIADMVRNGTVSSENYPKYIIPYTPISLAVIVGVLLLPLLIRVAKRFAVLVASFLSIGVFFLTELLLENQVIVTETVKTTLESWQMYMCYVPPDSYQTRTWRAVDVLIGDYSPAFKIHFYMISIVVILALLNCFYGFGQRLKSGDRRRVKALVMQSISTVLFLGLCIFACFTAFFRSGEITVSFISAVLMSTFFVFFGVTMGIYVGSFVLGKRRIYSVLLPAVVSILVTIIMYVGEMMLLSGHLYRFGTGMLFDGMGSIVFAPIDLFVILLSGVVCGLIMLFVGKTKNTKSYYENQ